MHLFSSNRQFVYAHIHRIGDGIGDGGGNGVESDFAQAFRAIRAARLIRIRERHMHGRQAGRAR